jgi:FixJ family two-component response regulator
MNCFERSMLHRATLPAGIGAKQLSRAPRIHEIPTVSQSNGSIGSVIPTVYVVDTDVSVRESLRRMILGAGWQASTWASAEEFLSRPPVLGPCCLLVDVVLPGLTGLDLQKLLAERTEVPIIFIAGEADVSTAIRAMKAGATDFLTKPLSEPALLEMVTLALERSKLCLRLLLENQVLRSRYASLRNREQQVMARVVAGKRNRRIGHELGISEITVKFHRSHMMQKMMARSLADLAKFAERLNHAPLSIPDADDCGASVSTR